MWRRRGGCEDGPFMPPERKRPCEYFSPSEIAGKELCFSVGRFQRRPQTNSAHPPPRRARQSRGGTLKICKSAILSWGTLPDTEIRYRADDNQVGSFDMTWRRQRRQERWAFTKDFVNKSRSSNSRHNKSNTLLLCLCYNLGRLRWQHVVFLPTDIQQVLSCY